MPELTHIDPRSAALLVLDYQVDTLTRFMTEAQSADAITCVPDLIAMARDAGMMVLRVVVAFRPGHPEVSPRNPLFSALKANGMAVAGSEGAAIHPAAAAREGEPIVVKHRISPFVGTDLETLLRANGVDTLVLAGVHTSGVVLSTVRHAGDLDYRLVVVRDCCADPDAEVHAVLLDIVIAKQAAVVTWRSSPAPCLAGLHEQTRAIDLEKRRHSVTNPFDAERNLDQLFKAITRVIARHGGIGQFRKGFADRVFDHRLVGGNKEGGTRGGPPPTFRSQYRADNGGDHRPARRAG
jgi:nicotinamidase-related amidase